jgi:hypothetical protein
VDKDDTGIPTFNDTNLQVVIPRMVAEAHTDPAWPIRLHLPGVDAFVELLNGTRRAPIALAPVALTVVNFAKRWNYSKRQIETYIRQGLPLVGQGRARRVAIAEGDAWMRTHADPTERRMREAARRHAARV